MPVPGTYLDTELVGLRDHVGRLTSENARVLRLLEFDTGHIGLTTSRRAHQQLWPQIASWLEKRC